MEPENNMENKIPVNNVPEEIVPEMEAMAAEEVVVTEAKPVADETPKDMPKGDIVFNDKPKKKTGMILCMILLFLIAAGGVGFGVWAWMDGNSQKDSLNAQIYSLKEQNSKLLEQLGEEDEEVIIDVETGTNSGESSSINPEDYIYIGEWGIKIKKGNFMLTSMRYIVSYGEGGEAFSLVGINPDLKSKLNPDTLYTAVPSVRVVRSTKSTYLLVDRGAELSPVYNDGEYNYFVVQPGGYTVPDELEYIASDISSSLTEMVDILENKENYSKI